MSDEEKNEEFEEEMNELSSQEEPSESAEEAGETSLANEFDVENVKEPQESFTQTNNEEQKIETPKKKRNKTPIIIAIICVIVLGAGAIGGFFAYKSWDAKSPYCMTYEGKRISLGTYEFYLLLHDGENVSADAIAQMQENLVITKKAKDKGLNLTQEELDELSVGLMDMKAAIESYDLTVPEIPDDEFIEILAVNNYAIKQIEQYGEQNYDEAEYQTEFADYKQNNQQDYMDINMKYILTDSLESAEEARTAILEGQRPLEEIMMEYSMVYEEAGAESISLAQSGLGPDEINEILTLEVNQPTSVIDMGGSYVVFIIETKSIPTDAEVEEKFKENYLYNKGIEAFKADLEIWKTEAKFVLNQKAIDEINALNGIVAPVNTPVEDANSAQDQENAVPQGETNIQ